MARERRSFIAGAIYHVYSRGSNRQAIFSFDSDRLDFLRCLDRVVRRFELRCFSYCLMPNHYHLVLQTTDARLSEAMKALNGRYALRFNRRHGRDAHLFRNRFGAVLQESEGQFLWALRYTAQNPVRSGLCADPGEWMWSSYRATAGMDPAPRLLDVAGVLSYFADDAESARAMYVELVTGARAPVGV